MSTKVPALQRTHINKTRDVLQSQKDFILHGTSQVLAKEMFELYIKVRYNGALNLWNEIQEFKRKFYSLGDYFSVICKNEFRDLRWEAGWDYRYSDHSGGKIFRVVSKKKD